MIDVGELGEEGPAVIAEAAGFLRARGMQIIGVREGLETLVEAASEAGLPLLNVGNATPVRRQVEKSEEKPVGGSLVIKQPVRSGQQVYARGGDLIVLSSVSPGAEVLADGHVHIYGTLRGRALAGVRGDSQARIFCHDLQAELLSVAGNYQINEQFKNIGAGMPVQVFLDEDTLRIEPL
ncbi:septum site-determining protein MinC [Alkalilimnicola ehrlichii]|uniref:septum site-determining protein MinC n=1 Tax=Alkalilimnicola ehrlichii TaxID=351052 RepID=UPI00216191A2|nr:septum site-determining protein MinC [Alkalilimnicola ehrlichii]